MGAQVVTDARRPRASRALRRDLSTVDDARARQLLQEFARIVDSAVRRYRAACRSTFHPLTPQDLRAIAEAAVLEAYVTYREGDKSRERSAYGGLAAWTRRVVFWRVGENVQGLLTFEPLLSERDDRLETRQAVAGMTARRDGVFPASLCNAASQEDVVQAYELVSWLRRRLADLSQRQRTIIVSVLNREPKVQIARRLGISKGRVSQEYGDAVAALREYARLDGIDGLDLVP